MNSLLPTVITDQTPVNQALLDLWAAQARFNVPCGPMLPQRAGASERSFWRLCWGIVLAATVVVPVVLYLI